MIEPASDEAMTSGNRPTQASESDGSARSVIDTLASTRRAYGRIVEAFAAGVAVLRGPSAEGITLYAGLGSHPGNGSIPEIVDEAITTLASDAQASTDE